MKKIKIPTKDELRIKQLEESNSALTEKFQTLESALFELAEVLEEV